MSFFETLKDVEIEEVANNGNLFENWTTLKGSATLKDIELVEDKNGKVSVAARFKNDEHLKEFRLRTPSTFNNAKHNGFIMLEMRNALGVFCDKEKASVQELFVSAHAFLDSVVEYSITENEYNENVYQKIKVHKIIKKGERKKKVVETPTPPKTKSDDIPF
jgi:hypothetical protein